jgi:hypothetical protein
VNKTSYVNNKAPIIHWQVTLTVKNDAQLKFATDWLIDNKTNYEIEFSHNEFGNVNEAYITVEDFPWAFRMKEFAEHLEMCDFDACVGCE